MDARKIILKGDEAWEMLSLATRVRVARGKQVVDFNDLGEDVRDELLKVVLGRTGNLRAPVLGIGTTCYVGYNEAMYEELTA